MKHTAIRFLLSVCLATSLGIYGNALAQGYTVVIPPQYDDVRDFNEGLAVVLIDGKWGYITIEK